MVLFMNAPAKIEIPAQSEKSFFDRMGDWLASGQQGPMPQSSKPAFDAEAWSERLSADMKANPELYRKSFFSCGSGVQFDYQTEADEQGVTVDELMRGNRDA